MSVVQVIAGLLLLAIGADTMIKGAASLGSRLGLSPIWIGIVFVGFGTSTPELLTSLRAAMSGSPGLALGNVVGSNIANILLILGAAALIRPLATSPVAFKRDMLVLTIATVLLIATVIYGVIGALAAVVFVGAFGVYLIVLYRAERRPADVASGVYKQEGEFITPVSGSSSRDSVLFFGGLLGVLIGAELLVRGATQLALLLGLSEAVVGLTIVAVGTSVPELTTSIVAALRGKADVAFGNIVGSNIFNSLAIMGVVALIAPIEVPAEIVRFDIWVLAGATGLLAVFVATNYVLKRWEAGIFIVLYGAYLAALMVPSLRLVVTGG